MVRAQQSAIGPKQEFRGAWVATVGNLDWPSSPGLSTAQQQAELIAILDGLKAAGVNAVLFQVRTEADAMYASDLEPWSYWLTGTQGEAPDPFYDPLEFAIEEAHARGMELHAWLNPYRADRGSSYTNATIHVTEQNPEWLLLFTRTGVNIQIFDPGLQVSRDRVSAVVADIVRRYDVDGIHFDDYFYPYPPNEIASQDAATFAANARGFTDIGDWRRDNVNLMVAQVQDSIQALDPSVAYGISPFGIWKSGTPTGTSGLDAFSVIYADATQWLDAQTIDYITPQLYWSSERAIDTNGDGTPDVFNRQRYSDLLPWWESVRGDRHLYPGLGAYRTGSAGYSSSEIPNQIRYTRSRSGAQGTVMFRVYDGILSGGLGLADSLETDLYRRPALTPTMAWKSQDAPAAPGPLAQEWTGAIELTLRWERASGGDAEAERYAVYKILSDGMEPDYSVALADPANLFAVTGDTLLVDQPNVESSAWYYVVTAVSANSIESAPSNASLRRRPRHVVGADARGHRGASGAAAQPVLAADRCRVYARAAGPRFASRAGLARPRGRGFARQRADARRDTVGHVARERCIGPGGERHVHARAGSGWRAPHPRRHARALSLWRQRRHVASTLSQTKSAPAEQFGGGAVLSPEASGGVAPLAHHGEARGAGLLACLHADEVHARGDAAGVPRELARARAPGLARG